MKKHGSLDDIDDFKDLDKDMLCTECWTFCNQACWVGTRKKMALKARLEQKLLILLRNAGIGKIGEKK